MSTQHPKQGTTRRYSDPFKRQVVEAIEEGRYTQQETAELYGCSQSSIHRWLKQYGKQELLNKVVRIQTMDEADRLQKLKQENQRLKQALAEAYMDRTLSESRLKIACEQLGIDPEEFKKKHDAGPFE